MGLACKSAAKSDEKLFNQKCVTLFLSFMPSRGHLTFLFDQFLEVRPEMICRIFVGVLVDLKKSKLPFEIN